MFFEGAPLHAYSPALAALPLALPRRPHHGTFTTAALAEPQQRRVSVACRQHSACIRTPSPPHLRLPNCPSTQLDAYGTSVHPAYHTTHTDTDTCPPCGPRSTCANALSSWSNNNGNTPVLFPSCCNTSCIEQQHQATPADGICCLAAIAHCGRGHWRYHTCPQPFLSKA